jgi:hypothetical protein
LIGLLVASRGGCERQRRAVIVRLGGIRLRRFADRRQQRGVAGILRGQARQVAAEIIFGRGGVAVTAAAEIDEAGIPREDLAFGRELGAEAPAEILLQPEGQPHLLHLAQQLVGGVRPERQGHQPRRPEALVEDRVVVGAAGELGQEIDPHQLLSEGRAALRQQQAQPVALPPFAPRPRGDFLNHPRQGAVIDPVVLEEILVFGR